MSLPSGETKTAVEMKPQLTTQQSLEHLWTVLGPSTLYLCLTSFLGERGWNFKMPLNMFESFKQYNVLPAIYVCWTAATLLNLVAIRCARAQSAERRWHRLPSAFGLFSEADSPEGKVWRVLWFALFYVFPIVHVCQFLARFSIYTWKEMWWSISWHAMTHTKTIEGIGGSFIPTVVPVMVIFLASTVVISFVTLLRVSLRGRKAEVLAGPFQRDSSSEFGL